MQTADNATPINPYPIGSGCWHSFNRSIDRQRLFAGVGYLYAIQRESDHAIKIGMSADPHTRLNGIRSAWHNRHDRYRLLFTTKVRAMQETERSAHALLRPYRIYREWFVISIPDAWFLLTRFAHFGEVETVLEDTFKTVKPQTRYRFE